MPTLILPKPLQKALVIGPIYDRLRHLSMISALIQQYDWLIFNGKMTLSPDNVEYMQQLLTQNVRYVIGRAELLFLKNFPEHQISQWIKTLPNVILAEFSNRNVLIMDGGLTNQTNKNDLLVGNLEVSFVSQVNQQPWHISYNGRLGYVVSNNPLLVSPNYHHYSMQLGNIDNGFTFAQEIDNIGLKSLFAWQ